MTYIDSKRIIIYKIYKYLLLGMLPVLVYTCDGNFNLKEKVENLEKSCTEQHYTGK